VFHIRILNDPIEQNAANNATVMGEGMDASLRPSWVLEKSSLLERKNSSLS
jgi:hypothetical protein